MRVIKLSIFLLTACCFFAEAQQYVLRNVNVIPMDQETVLKQRDVLIKDGLIESLVPYSKAATHSGYEVIEGNGRYLIPGLADMHMHFLADDRIADEYRKDELLVPLKYGVLRGRVPIGNPGLLRDKGKITGGQLLGPSLLVGSPQLAGVNFSAVFSGSLVKSFQEGYDAVKRYSEQGYSFIKITFGLNEEAYRGIVKAGEDFNIPIAGHVPVAIKIREAIKAGQDVEHLDQYMDAILKEDSPTKTGLSAFGIFQKKSWATMNFIDAQKVEELIALTVDAGIWNTPTNHFFISSFARFIPEDVLSAGPSYSLVSPEVRTELLDYRDRYWSESAEKELREKYVEMRSYLIREIFRKNGRILAGSDSPEWLNLYGYALHQELENFVNVVGLTPYEALQTATTKPSEYMNTPNIGMVRVGQKAELVLLKANPLSDIRNIRDVDGVMLNGKWLSKEKLDQLYQQAKQSIQKAPLRSEFKR